MVPRDYNLSDMDALKAFLLDIECLEPLNEWASWFNLFDILKITRTEIRHSNVLAWLLSPNENHGLSDKVLRGFIQYAITCESGNDFDVFSTLLMDLNSFNILREWKNIDILAVSEEEKFVICIENKIDSGEHSNQLNRYRDIVEHTYPGYRYMYIFLSPDRVPASDEDTWATMGYGDVLEILTSAVKQVELLPDAALLINNYIDTLRRDIVGDERLAQICADIYAKHGKALDLIFEHRPDRASHVADVIKAWCLEKQKAGLLEIDLERSGKSIIRFTTPYMSLLFPDSQSADSGWNTKKRYYYEISNYVGERIGMGCVVSSRNLPEELITTCNKIDELFLLKNRKENWQWRTFFPAKPFKISRDTSDEKIAEMLDRQFAEVQASEKQLEEKLEQGE